MLEWLAAGEPSGIGQWQETQLDPGPQAAVRALAVGVHLCGYRILP